MKIEDMDLGELRELCEESIRDGLDTASGRAYAEWDGKPDGRLWHRVSAIRVLAEPCLAARAIRHLLERAHAPCENANVLIKHKFFCSISTDSEFVSVNIKIEDVSGVLLRLIDLAPGAGVVAARGALAGE